MCQVQTGAYVSLLAPGVSPGECGAHGPPEVAPRTVQSVAIDGRLWWPRIQEDDAPELDWLRGRYGSYLSS